MAKITLNHLVYQVLEFASSGTLANEINITYELAQEWVEEQRAILIGQALNRKDQINDSWIQYLTVDLQQVDSGECCGEATGCYLLKSIQKLPSSIDTYLDNWIVSVNTPAGQQVSKSNPIRQRYSTFSKYTGLNRIYWIKDDYLYIKNEKFIEKVGISGLFEHPSDVARFTCENGSCFTEDSDYPVSLTLASQIVDIINKTKIAPFLQFPADTSNNQNSANPKQTEEQKQAGK